MSNNNYVLVSGLVFGFIAIAQAARALMQIPVHAGSFEVPVWGSWVAAAVTGALCAWAFRSRSTP